MKGKERDRETCDEPRKGACITEQAACGKLRCRPSGGSAELCRLSREDFPISRGHPRELLLHSQAALGAGSEARVLGQKSGDARLKWDPTDGQTVYHSRAETRSGWQRGVICSANTSPMLPSDSWPGTSLLSPRRAGGS